MTHPLLDRYTLPDFSALTPETIAQALDEGLARYAAVVEQLVAARPTEFASLWLPLETAETELDALWSAVSHLNGMTSDEALRAAYSEGQAKLVDAFTAVRQNADLYALLQALSETPAYAQLPQSDRAAVAHLVRDFKLSGVALEPRQCARFAALTTEQSKLENDFSNAVVDATDAWSEQVLEVEALKGVPEASLGMFAAAAKDKGLEGWLVTLQQPSIMAILTFCENRGLRARVYEAAGTRASEQGPHAGRFDNSTRIAQILEIRREAAALLGFDTPVAWSLATKMANDADEVLGFLRNIVARAKPAAERDLAALKAFAAETLGLADLQPWDVGFAANQLRKAKYAVDEEKVRAFFPVEQVLEGWKALLVDLYGIALVERTDVSLWAPEAGYYELIDSSGQTLGGLYVDLHARPGKRGGAWMAPARPRLVEGGVVHKPVAYLTCNFAPKGGDEPCLLSHGDIVTLLHETGHCLHHLLSTVERPSIAGVNGFEWDAVELPSQLMEDFAWDYGLLAGMSRHVSTGEALPRDLFDKLLAARHFQAAMGLLRQIEFSLFDILLHQGLLGDDPMAVLGAVRQEVAVIQPPAWHRFPHAFSHVFAGGYDAGYYSYLWAEVLSADGFQRFVEGGLVSREVGDLFRKEVLARGASRPAAESFRAFRGRDPDPTALFVRHGLAA